MLHFYDRTTMAQALTLELEPRLKNLLTTRITSLSGDLIDWTEYLVVEAGDSEADIVKQVGFSPLVDPLTGACFGEPDFQPVWDWLVDHCGWFEMVVTFGSTFACVLLIDDDEGAQSLVPSMCRYHASTAASRDQP